MNSPDPQFDLDLQETLVLEAQARRRQMLHSAFGPMITAALADADVVEVMVNPDGTLWVDRLGSGRENTQTLLKPVETERIIRLVAAHMRGEVHEGAPIISAELPHSGERFEGVLPPAAPAPCFSIRKPAQKIFELLDYVKAGIMSPVQARALSEAVITRQNIVIVGGTSSGKTTLVNALLSEVAETGDRVVILEDTHELQCAAADKVYLRTKPGVAGLKDLVRSTLRLRPDRIIVGEVRGAEALEMLKAWNTGHPGGITTLHANSAQSGLYRLEQLIQEAVITVPRHFIADAIDVLVFIEGRGAARNVRTLLKLTGLNKEGEYQLSPLIPVSPATV